MDDGMLSQEEIDALLNIGNDSSEENSTKNLSVSEYLTDIEADTLGEIGNISIGSSATTLSTLLNQKVDITTPTISIITKKNLMDQFPYEHLNIQVNYLEGFIGESMFVLKSEDAAIIADILLGGDGSNPDQNLSEIHLSAVQEVMNQMMGSAATSMSTIFNKRVNISPPSVELIDETGEPDLTKEIEEEVFVKVSFDLVVGDLIDSQIMQIIPFPFAHELVAELIEQGQETPEEEVAATVMEKVVEEEASYPDEYIQREQPTDTVSPMEDRIEEPVVVGGKVRNVKESIQPASFSEFEPVTMSQSSQRNLEMLLDIPLRVTVELGRTKKTVEDILDLSSGSIIELDKLAGEPVDILVNNKLVAQGEVVVIDENFGVRVTDIISKTDRLMNLK